MVTPPLAYLLVKNTTWGFFINGHPIIVRKTILIERQIVTNEREIDCYSKGFLINGDSSMSRIRNEGFVDLVSSNISVTVS